MEPYALACMLLFAFDPFVIPTVGPFQIPDVSADPLAAYPGNETFWFTADNCPPCGVTYATFPALVEAGWTFGDETTPGTIRVIHLDSGRANARLAAACGVDAANTFVRIENGKVVRKHEGTLKGWALREFIDGTKPPLEKQLLWFQPESESHFDWECYPLFLGLVEQGVTFGERGNVRIVNVGEEPELVEKHGAVPGSFVFLRRGKVVKSPVEQNSYLRYGDGWPTIRTALLREFRPARQPQQASLNFSNHSEWTYPGDIYSHLLGTHRFTAQELQGLSQHQMEELHYSEHERGNPRARQQVRRVQAAMPLRRIRAIGSVQSYCPTCPR